MKEVTKSFYISLLSILSLFFNHIHAITSAQASKMLQDAEKAKKEIVAESQTVFQMLEQDITTMDKAQLTAWKTKLRESLRQMNKDAAIVLGTALVVPQGTEIPELLLKEEETLQVPAPLDIPEAPVIVHHEEEYDEFTNDLKNIKSFAKRPVNNKNIGTFDFVAWFKETENIEQKIKKVPFYDTQINALHSLVQDTKNVIVNASAQWIVAYLNLQFSGPQAPFHLYFTTIRNWINDSNTTHAKTMLSSTGSSFAQDKNEIRQKTLNLVDEVNTHLVFLINNGKNMLSQENRELVSNKIQEYIFGTFKNDNVAGKVNIDRSVYAIVQEAIKYINYAFTTNITTQEKQAVKDFDHAVIAPSFVTLLVTQKNVAAFNPDFDKNNSIKNATSSLLQQREKIEKAFGYHEE